MLDSLIQTGIHAIDPKNNEIKEETRHQSPLSLSLFLARQKHPFLSLLSPSLYPSKNTRVYFEPRDSLPLLNRDSQPSIHAACSALPIGRRDARAFSVAGARDPTPTGASDQASPPASRITGAARKQPPGCFVLPSRPSPGIASRFPSPLSSPSSRRNDRGKKENGRWTKRKDDIHPSRGWSKRTCIETLFLSLAPSPPPSVSSRGVFVTFYCIGCIG